MRLGIALALAAVFSLATPGRLPAQDASKTQVRKPTSAGSKASVTPRARAAVSGRVAIDDPAPGFELESSAGGWVRHSSLRGKWVVVAFADRWQPLARLEATHQRLRPIGARIVGICHEKQQTLLAAARRDSLSMTLLADPTGEIAGLYGVYDWAHTETQPGFFILDRDGVVRLVVLGQIFPDDQMFETVEFLKEAYRARR